MAGWTAAIAARTMIGAAGGAVGKACMPPGQNSGGEALGSQRSAGKLSAEGSLAPASAAAAV